MSPRLIDGAQQPTHLFTRNIPKCTDSSDYFNVILILTVILLKCKVACEFVIDK